MATSTDTKMTTEEGKAILMELINKTADADERAKLQFTYEFIFNAKFRTAVKDYVWEQVQ